MEIEKMSKTDWKIVNELTTTLLYFGAKSDLMSITGSWKDTLPDAEILELMKEYNKNFKEEIEAEKAQDVKLLDLYDTKLVQLYEDCIVFGKLPNTDDKKHFWQLFRINNGIVYAFAYDFAINVRVSRNDTLDLILIGKSSDYGRVLKGYIE